MENEIKPKHTIFIFSFFYNFRQIIQIEKYANLKPLPKAKKNPMFFYSNDIYVSSS